MTAYRNVRIYPPTHQQIVVEHTTELGTIPENIAAAFKVFITSSKLIEDESFFHILQNKIQGKPARAFFVTHLAAYLKQIDATSEKKCNQYHVFFQKELPFILEAIISIQYYHNQILDGKAGVITPAAINDNLIKGNLLKDELYRYIDELAINCEDKLKLTRTVRSIFEHVDVGQYIEKHCNTYQAYQHKNLNHPFTSFMQEKIESDTAVIDTLKEIENIITEQIPIPRADLSFLQLYLRRIYLTNTSLYKLITDFITDFLDIQLETRHDAIKFSISFAMAHQMVNDNIDFVPSYYGEATKSKKPFDAFSDLKNKNITLPILVHLLRKPQGEIAKFLNYNHSVSNEEKLINRRMERDFLSEITDTHSIYYSMSIVKRIKKLAENYLLLQYKKAQPLIGMLQIMENNRFYKYYYEKPAYKRYKKVRLNQK